MTSYDKKEFKYNPNIVKKSIKEVGDSLVAVDDIRVIFPVRYVNKKLAYITNVVKVLTIFAVVDKDNNYGTVLGTSFITLTPGNISEIEIDGVINKVLTFEKDRVFAPTILLVASFNYLFPLFEEFFLNGKIPWFLLYKQVSNVYLGSPLGRNPLATEILTAIIARNKHDKRMFIRQMLEDNSTVIDTDYIGLSNIYYSFDNTNSKINGSRYDEGVTSAVINKETKTTKIADILRS